MEDSEPSLLCYNQGCGQEYKESENTATSCRFHPGTHYFHDAYKGWTCCRKTTDFTEFLNMKGCTVSFHSNIKPPEPEKKKQEVFPEEVQVSRPKYVPIERPSVDAPLIELKAALSESLKKQTYEQNQFSQNQDIVPELKVGVTQCVNQACRATYQGLQSDSEPEACKYHPGVPIFHEGLKYWSCCQKKTIEFDVFMKQEGCKTGSHLWIKPRDEKAGGVTGVRVINCRNDWHQDGSHVEVVIYGGGKKFDPTKSRVKVNGVKLVVEVLFPEENGLYQETWILAGVISPDLCSVLMTPMKIEIKLKKAEPVKWSSLNVLQPQSDTSLNNAGDENEHKSVGVEPVDLDDL